MASLKDPIGTPHNRATCCWCTRALVVGDILGLRCWLCPVDCARQATQALVVTSKQGKESIRRCVNVPLPSQVMFEEATATNVLWGGQAGPGKSHGVRQWLYKRSLVVPNHKALLLRENYGQLETTHLFDMRRELPALGARLANDTAYFANGSEIHCGHMADFAALQRYLGTEYGVIVPEEGSVYPVDTRGVTALAELSTRARKVYTDINGNEVLPRFMPVTNPGGPSAQWLRDMFIDHTPDYDLFPRLRPVYDETGRQTDGYIASQWVYIPAKVTDNPYIREDYHSTTLANLSGVRYKQLAEGDWYAFDGAFFGEWDASVHVRELRAA